jgi:hypothetical protein
MPAYSIQLKVKCDKPSCTKRASMKVFDTWNGERGIYCSTHAKQWVVDWNRQYEKHPHDGRCK